MDAAFEGTTTIAPAVLNTIARLATLGIPGVSRLATPGIPGVARIDKAGKFGATVEDGVLVFVEDDSLVYIDVYIVVDAEENVRLVAEHVQTQVSRAIREMAGMEVAKVDVHITDIDLKA